VRVVCQATRGEDLPQRIRLRNHLNSESRFNLTKGRLYTVFGMTFRGPDAVLLVLDDTGKPHWYLLAAFSIRDARLPTGWLIGELEHSVVGLVLGYASLAQVPTHHDDLINRSKRALRAFLTECDRAGVDPREAEALNRLDEMSGRN
jgi:hypothetical protein